MSEPVFTPAGFLWTRDAVVQATRVWFAAELASYEADASPPPVSTGDPLRDAIMSRQQAEAASEAADQQIGPYLQQAANRIRGALFEGTLIAFYPSPFNGRLQPIGTEFWISRVADGVLESGEYDPFGAATMPASRVNSERVYVSESDLIALLGNKDAITSNMGSMGNKPGLPKQRQTQQSTVLRDAFAVLFPEGLPDQKTMSHQQLVGAVLDHITKIGGLKPSPDTILRAAKRKK